MPDNKVISNVENAFTVSRSELKKVMSGFHSEMKKGLSGQKGSLKMIPTFVQKPNGREKGIFLALDLGGTNFRVLMLELKGKRKVHPPLSSKFTLKKRHITGTGTELFDFIARCIRTFMKKHKISIEGKYRIGFTFSFPVKKRGIASGVLVRWTKGFCAKGVEGKNVVKLLNKSLRKAGLCNSKIVVLANDTVSTLVARSYEDKNCDVGVILGTGTNACYSEKLSNIKKCKLGKTSSGDMIINTEWGNFNKLRLTSYDKELDKSSGNPGEQILEKMVSGMYLGELVRIVLKDLIGNGVLFEGRTSSLFKRPGNFKTEYTSIVEDDNSRNLSDINALLKRLGVSNSTYTDRKLIKRMCMLVSGRAARISVAAMVSLVTKIDPGLSRKHTIAIDGTVYEKHPGFSRRMRGALKEILKRKADKIKLALTKDASAKGAAIIAAANSF